MQVLLYFCVILLFLMIGASYFAVGSKLFENQALMDYAIQTANTFVLKVNFDGRIVDANEAFLSFSGYTKEGLLQKMEFVSLLEGIEGDKLTEFIGRLTRNDAVNQQFSLRRAGGGVSQVEWHVKPMRDIVGLTRMFVFIGEDVTPVADIEKEFETARGHIESLNVQLGDAGEELTRKSEYISTNEKKLEQETRRHRFTMDAVGIGAFELDVASNHFSFSGRMAEVHGFSSGQPFHKYKPELLKALDPAAYFGVLQAIHQAMSQKKAEYHFTLPLYLPENRTRWVEYTVRQQFDAQGQAEFLAGSAQDVTPFREYEQQIEQMSCYDSLTGLYNKAYFSQYVNDFLQYNPERPAGLIFMDIDDFKLVNDSFGHDFGDQIIIQLAEKLMANRGGNKACRFTGDEVALFVTSVYDLRDMTGYVDSLLKDIDISYTDNSIHYHIGLSAGGAYAPDHGGDFNTLLRCADIALHEAKASGKNKYVVFTENMNIRFQERIQMEKDLKSAIDSGTELRLYLQPQYHIDSGELYGFEALTRWVNPMRGFVSPDVFIAIAEETRLIIPQGRWVLQESCRVLEELNRRGYRQMKISVNLSPVQLLDEGLIPMVADILKRGEIDPRQLELEITENILMENFESNINKLHELRDLGISIALDDFGKGYSSLTYLKLLPMNTLKIDRSFVAHITNSEIDLKITREIIMLSHVLDFQTVAEGVETMEQLNLLKDLGCDVVQGYLGGRPMPCEDIYQILDKEMLS